ncbi:hypothetical protein GCM10010405_13780 [Streptomyces macrosporus]|uniref:Uncharacterized protein n=2 Tax=Streptomyces macrosporus TaxID=44032 RepID=A0ABP5WNW8_9ACTN
MLPEALIALAASAGTAVVQAAGTDAWDVVRRRVAAWFGRGGEDGDALARLDHTARVLGTAEDGPRELAHQEGTWQVRFETHLERLDEPERESSAAALRTLLEEIKQALTERGTTWNQTNIAHGQGRVFASQGGSVIVTTLDDPNPNPGTVGER